MWCRGRFANTTHKEWHFRAGGQIDAATNWAKGFCDGAPSRITGAVNGSFYDWHTSDHTGGPTYILGDLWEKNYGGNMQPTDNGIDATHTWRYCVGFNELGSQYGVEHMGDYQKLKGFDYARSNVICMLYNGNRKDDVHPGSPVADKNEATWRTLLVWGSSQPNRSSSGGITGKEFFLICAELESWNTMKDVLKPGGLFCQTLMKAPYNIRLNVETIVWLDGGSSSQISYKYRSQNNTVEDYERGGQSRGSTRWIPDFVGVWATASGGAQ